MMTHKCENEKIIDDMKKDIYGNSRPGIKADVITLQEKMKSLVTVNKILIGMQTIILAAVVIQVLR